MPEEKEETTYTVYVKCSNCGWDGNESVQAFMKIPKGTSAATFLSGKQCVQCDCATLGKTDKK